MTIILKNIQGPDYLEPSVMEALLGLNPFKLIFVLFLFVLTIVLFLYPTQSDPKGCIQESGLGNKTLKDIIYYGSAAATFFGTGLAIKSELVSGKLFNAQKELHEKRELISKSIDQLKQVEESIKALDAKNYAVKMINYKIDNRYKDLKSSTSAFLDDAISLRDMIDDPALSVSDKISRIRDFKNTSNIFFEREIGDFKKLSDKLSLDNAFSLESTPNCLNEPSDDALASSCNASNTLAESSNPPSLKEDVIKEANIINWDWFGTLSVWEKLAVSLLLSKALLLSALLGLIFNLYGGYLLSKYNIENRFPRLATVIKLRRTFSRYYLIFDCSMILGVIILESIFSFYILYIHATI